MIIPHKQLADFSKRWKIRELALFGSILRDDFKPDSDVDVLVDFEPDAQWTLFDLRHMREELRQIFGCEVDLLTRRAVERSLNQRRKRAILSTARVIYAT
ncbi:MAG: nucleotidyltransferase family protein [Calditrichota bacterium]